MDPQHVRYFLAVVDHGSINGAASSLGVAQPTISQALRLLERELKTPLFHRVGRGMVPTSAGHALVSPGRTLLRDLGVAAGAVPDADGLLRGHLDIRAFPAANSVALAHLIRMFNAVQPRVSLHLGVMWEEARTTSLLRSAVCEIVVTHLPYPESHDADEGGGFDTLTLGRQEYVLAFPPGFDVPDHDPIAWEEIDFPIVAAPPGGRHADEIYAHYTAAQQARRPAVVVQNREARLAFALGGVSPTWIERSMTETATSRGGQVRSVAPALRTPYGLVFDGAGLSPAAAAFVAMARDYADAAQDDDAATWTNASAAGDS